jgi:hypothetical protein
MADNLVSILEATRNRHGVLDRDTLLADATDPTHPLHHRLVWDDSVAGHEYRREQCAGIIRSQRVRFVTRDEAADVRAYLAVPVDNHPTRRHYVPTEEVAQNPFQRRLALQTAQREYLHLMARYRHLDEFMAWVADDQAGGAA